MSKFTKGDRITVIAGDSDFYAIGHTGIISSDCDDKINCWVDFSGDEFNSNDFVQADGVWCVDYKNMEINK